MVHKRQIFQALVFGFVLAITGCSDDPQNGGTAGTGGSGTAGTGGSGTGGTGGGTGGNGGSTGGDVMAGLYSGSVAGYNVCFYVAGNTVELADDTSCDVDSTGFPNAFDIDVKAGTTPAGCEFDFDYEVDTWGSVPINAADGTFSGGYDVAGVTFSFSGTINGNSASGTASTNTPDCSVNWEASH